MRVSLMVDPEGGVRYGTLAAMARYAEELGFAGLYLSDHYDAVFGWHGPGAPETWALLAGLMRETERIALGTLVTPVTLRRFATLVKLVATVGLLADDRDETGPSRVHLGLGAGWLESEHDRFGVPFPHPTTRFDMLEEHLRAIHAVWKHPGVPVTFAGAHVRLADAQFSPLPKRPRIVLGGKGRVRMPRLAARFADELNVPFVSLSELTMLRQLLHDACREIDREPDSIVFSAKRGILVGSTRSELEDRATTMQALAGDDRSTPDYLDWLRTRWIVGVPDEAAAQVAELRRAGVEHLILQHLLPHDLDMLSTVRDEVLPAADSILSGGAADRLAGRKMWR